VPSRITEQEIRDLVYTFYGRVREDACLGPVFEGRLAGRWEPHLEKMCDFWSSVLLATGRFEGNPVEAHLRVPDISPGHFDRWIELFERTAHDVLRAHLATDVAGRAARMRAMLERFACPALARN
jgi:hemoglobin